ncbi:MAG: HlyD family secretion protein [Desulfurella sp.]|uniref:HlyD family secretion protein n=1 Tax=Desulfurella sp. TaxID=1962857 RepID=UPI003C772671
MTKKTKKFIQLLVILLILAGLAIYFIPKLIYDLNHVSTDDAYIDGTIVPISPQVAGKVIKVYVKRNQFVKKGQILFEIDPTDYIQQVKNAQNVYQANVIQMENLKLSILEKQAAIQKAQQDLKASDAKLTYAQKQNMRYYNLLKEKVISPQEYDSVKMNYSVALADFNARLAAIKQLEIEIADLKTQLLKQEHLIKQSKAQLDIASINLSRTKVIAPIDGYVTKRNVEIGQYAQVGLPLLNIVNLHHVWVVANFKETAIHNIHIGAKVAIKVDAYPGKTFYGYVESFQTGSGAVFSLLPPQNAVGNFIKIVQRIPVKINITTPYNPKTPLYPGLSVEPYVSIK